MLKPQFVGHEQFWLDVARHLHPRQFSHLLKACDADAFSAFRRVQGEVMFRLFDKIALVERQPHGKPRFEFLMQEGYIPWLAPNLEVCDHYYETPQGQWFVPNSTMMRTFWHPILESMLPKWAVQLETSLKAVILMLPAEHYDTCSDCGWQIPRSDMYTEECCDFCYFRKQYKSISLQKQKNQTFLKLVKHEQ